ncbi:MAG TPA: cytochrome c oxidase subunit II [Thermaerobacter sp.]
MEAQGTVRQRAEGASRRMGAFVSALVGFVLVVSVVSTVYAAKRWWLPPLISTTAAPIDRLFGMQMLAMGVVFVLTQGLLAWFVWRAGRAERAMYWHENRRLEIGWTVATATILTAFILTGYQIWLALHTPAAAEAGGKTAVVEVWGRQFYWLARYPGPDGQFGTVDPKYEDYKTNPLGIDPNDPAGKDDIVVDGSKGEPIPLPAGYKVTVRLQSKDVIHSFFVPHLRVKLDAVPGQVNELYIDATETGKYEIACAELCGVGHFQMRGEIQVMDEAAWQDWVQQQAQQRAAGQ